MSRTPPRHRTDTVADDPFYAMIRCYRSRLAAVPAGDPGDPADGFDALPDSQMAPGGTGAWSEESHLFDDHVMPTIGVGFAFTSPVLEFVDV